MVIPHSMSGCRKSEEKASVPRTFSDPSGRGGLVPMPSLVRVEPGRLVSSSARHLWSGGRIGRAVTEGHDGGWQRDD
jgi:hypothetical protein